MYCVYVSANQVVVPSDITDLLLHEEPSSQFLAIQPTPDPATSLDGYRKLLLEGRRKVSSVPLCVYMYVMLVHYVYTQKCVGVCVVCMCNVL